MNPIQREREEKEKSRNKPRFTSKPPIIGGKNHGPKADKQSTKYNKDYKFLKNKSGKENVKQTSGLYRTKPTPKPV